MNYYNIYGNKTGEPIKLLFNSVIEPAIKTSFETASKLGYEITNIIKLGNHSNFFIDEDVTDEIKNKIQN